MLGPPAGDLPTRDGGCWARRRSRADRHHSLSYDWLERAVGDKVRNADRIHPEWQALAAGDLVRATQPDSLGGVFDPDIGWRVVRLEPQRALVLGGWGAFVLEPKNGYTRLIVRARGAGKPNVALAPLGLLVFEPAHAARDQGAPSGCRPRWVMPHRAARNP